MAVTLLKITVGKFNDAKQFAEVLGGASKVTFVKLLDEAVQKRDQAINDNKTLFNEPECSPMECPRPQPQNFVRTISMLDDINIQSSVEGKLMYLVPPVVQQWDRELKNILQRITSDQLGKIQYSND